MEITIYIPKIYSDIRVKSHRDVATIENVEARYLIEAGTEKDDEIYAGIVNANDSLKMLLHTFLVDCVIDYTDDQVQAPESYIYELDLTPRRAVGKAQPLADAMHEYLVHAALMRVYEAVNGTELRAKHEAAANAAAGQITTLLYTKARPRLV